MIALSTIKAPIWLQLNRAVFVGYSIFFSWPLWTYRGTISAGGLIIFTSFVFLSLIGLGYSFIRLQQSRWVLTVLNLAIPAVFWTFMCLTVFSKPAWWEWPLDIFFASVIWLGYPSLLAASLFRDKKTSDFFCTSTK